MTKKYGFGVIGCGSIAEIAHLPSIQRTPEAELIACCDINEQQAKETASRWGAKVWYTDHKEMFHKCDELSAVITNIDKKGRKISLSIKELKETTDKQEVAEYMEKQEVVTSALGEQLKEKFEVKNENW